MINTRWRRKMVALIYADGGFEYGGRSYEINTGDVFFYGGSGQATLGWFSLLLHWMCDNNLCSMNRTERFRAVSSDDGSVPLGSQIAEEYSSLLRTNVFYISSFKDSGANGKFLFRKPNMRLAFLMIYSM
ncbi:unnamed protein product [Ixodes pacificus]